MGIEGLQGHRFRQFFFGNLHNFLLLFLLSGVAIFTGTSGFRLLIGTLLSSYTFAISLTPDLINNSQLALTRLRLNE